MLRLINNDWHFDWSNTCDDGFVVVTLVRARSPLDLATLFFLYLDEAKLLLLFGPVPCCDPHGALHEYVRIWNDSFVSVGELQRQLWVADRR